MYVCVHACVCASVGACVRWYVHACVRASKIQYDIIKHLHLFGKIENDSNLVLLGFEPRTFRV